MADSESKALLKKSLAGLYNKYYSFQEESRPMAKNFNLPLSPEKVLDLNPNAVVFFEI